MFLSLHPMESISLNSIRFARASSHVADFNTHNNLLTKKLLKQGIGIINFAKPFLNFIDDTLI